MEPESPREKSVDRVFRFGVFDLSRRSGELRKQGIKIRLQDQPFCVLVKLLESPGDLVAREEPEAQRARKGTVTLTLRRASAFLYSEDQLLKKIVEDMGTRPPEGIEFVLVNRKSTVDTGETTGALPGRVLLRSEAQQ